ncbi:pyrroloquinoline quinone-dependent dehydrogenase [Pendulispora brunnea]|uniref:Pyrroloquinoline quinone-dependent dehydrogenase n=1 Tax=Pendulispora brunnea TaxID=2905690 RepID=A0ABZ2KID6_9BACT
MSTESALGFPNDGEWPAYGRDPGGARHSPLTQIDRDNVSRLQNVWTFHTGDISDGRNHPTPSNFEATPLYLFGTLYLSTGFDRVIALDPDTGAQRWAFDPKINLDVRRPGGLTSRGVAAWEDIWAPAHAPCRRRIFLATLDARLIALDALTGKLCTDFADGGTASVKGGLDDLEAGHFGMTSPPAVVNGVVIVGSSVVDGVGVAVPKGLVHAFDARTGAAKWTWDPIPRRPSDPGYDAWSPKDAARTRAANVWTVIAVDAKRDLVFLPTSSPAPDYYGGLRKGPGPHADSIVALRASTGKFVWAYQLVHHNLWDYDIAAPPALTVVRHHGRKVPAIAAAGKTGFLFVLDRETGVPLFPVEERPVPASDLPGEEAYATQPFPIATPNLVGDTTIPPASAFGLTPGDVAACARLIAEARSEGIFTPVSRRGSIQFPGPVGGVNWGGMAIDEARGLLITAVNRLPDLVRAIPRDEAYVPFPGEAFYEQTGTPYRVGRRVPVGPELGLPCTQPPFGKLVAVDLGTGRIRWEVPVGRLPGTEQIPGAERWGSATLGGPIVTDGGLAFIAGTMDDAIRAFDIDTGKELWKAPLPAGGQATPMTYRSPHGKQFVIIAAGGSTFLGRPPSDALVAFALPD